MEGPTEKTGSVAFEVILKPASSDAPPAAVVGSPTKERPLSQGDIERKLKEAEERRLSMEASKLHPIAKDKERIHEANQKAQELAEAFAKETEKKLSEKMEAFQENKNAQLQAKQERLKEHDRHVQEVRMKKMSQSEDPSAPESETTE
jgi:stathmin